MDFCEKRGIKKVYVRSSAISFFSFSLLVGNACKYILRKDLRDLSFFVFSPYSFLLFPSFLLYFLI